ncbi:MAG: transposase, partial [Promethearchaeota archaeon]
MKKLIFHLIYLIYLDKYNDRLEVVKLPVYSADLNDIEVVWREVKKDVVYNT